LIVSKVIQPAPFAAIYGLLQGPPKKGAKAPDGAKSIAYGPEKVRREIALVSQPNVLTLQKNIGTPFVPSAIFCLFLPLPFSSRSG
jgi:hypothetical protein